MADLVLRRHDLVRVDPAAWAAMLAGRPDLVGIDLLPGWAEAGHPLVVRRRNMDDGPGQVALGLPLPPRLGKRRIAVALDPAAIRNVGRFPQLRTAADWAPSCWGPMIDGLLGLGDAVGIEPLVFGSLAWVALTGLDYLGPDSDLDLLWPIGWGQDVSSLIEGLALIQSQTPVRIDGEILDPDGRGADWHELASGVPELLVKGNLAVELLAAQSFGQARGIA